MTYPYVVRFIQAGEYVISAILCPAQDVRVMFFVFEQGEVKSEEVRYKVSHQPAFLLLGRVLAGTEGFCKS